MAISAGKIISGSKLEFHSRSFLTPWLKKNFIGNCSKHQDYRSSFPVKYVPRKHSRTSELQISSPPVRSPDDKEIEKRSEPNALADRFLKAEKNLRRDPVLDDQYPNGAVMQTPRDFLTSKVESVPETEEEINQRWRLVESEFMEEPEEPVEELKIYQEEEAEEQLAEKACGTKEHAERAAIGFLAARAFTAAELKKKLLGRKYSPDIVGAVIVEFQIRGLINDFLFAEMFSRSRWTSHSWGPRRIKQALFERGVGKEDAEKAVELVFGEDESDDGLVSRIGLSKQSMDHLLAQASKQWIRSQDAPLETRKSRIVTWLQYRGFSWGVVNFVLKKLRSKYPP